MNYVTIRNKTWAPTADSAHTVILPCDKKTYRISTQARPDVWLPTRYRSFAAALKAAAKLNEA